MANPYDSVAAKIARAEETAQLLLNEVEAFRRSNATPCRVVGELRNDGREYVFTAYGEITVPLRFSVLLGEVMYQLRTALDHVVSALVRTNGYPITDKHQFPIASTHEKFVQAVKRKELDGIGETAVNRIELLQSYHSTDPGPHVLTLLREWSNADKHRLLVVISIAAMLGNGLVIEEADGPMTVIGMTPPFAKHVPSEGVEVFTIYFAEAHAHFRASLNLRTEVAVECPPPVNHASVEEVLVKIIGYVKYVVAVLQAA